MQLSHRLHSNKETHWITETAARHTMEEGWVLVGQGGREERDDGSSRRERGTEDGDRR